MSSILKQHKVDFIVIGGPEKRKGGQRVLAVPTFFNARDFF